MLIFTNYCKYGIIKKQTLAQHTANLYIGENMVEQKLQELLQKAKKNNILRLRLLETKNSDDPIKSFCEIARKEGFEIYPGELFACGMTMNDAKLRATNGGGSFEIEGWNDLYENFIDELNAC